MRASWGGALPSDRIGGIAPVGVASVRISPGLCFEEGHESGIAEPAGSIVLVWDRSTRHTCIHDFAEVGGVSMGSRLDDDSGRSDGNESKTLDNGRAPAQQPACRTLWPCASILDLT